MSVEFEPKNNGCFSFGAPNKHFFDLLKDSEFSKIIGSPLMTNDPLDIDHETALRLAQFMKGFNSKTWGGDKEMYIDFFENCGGFKTF